MNDTKFEENLKKEKNAFKISFLSFAEALIDAGGAVSTDCVTVKILNRLSQQGISIKATYAGPAVEGNKTLHPTDHLRRILESYTEFQKALGQAKIHFSQVDLEGLKEELVIYEQNSISFEMLKE